MPKVFIQTFGCQMNEADSQEMYLALRSRGFEPASSRKEADAILINTCTVRHHAEHRALSYIGRLKFWKEARPGRSIIVAGCAAQRLGKEITSQFPFVDLVAGAKSISQFGELINKIDVIRQLPSEAAKEQSCGICAYTTVMRGCSHSCAYCIVPSVRGTAVSLSPEEILEDIKEKVRLGAKEITLLGQTVNSYRSGDTDFTDLITAAHEINGLERIRFMSPHPLYLNEKLIRAFGELPKLAKHIHLPLQSGSDRILSVMKRGYTRKDIIEKINALRKATPDIAISTDFIVGFPSETDEEFSETVSLTRELEFSSAYCFKYSPRKGTPAAEMPEQVPETAKKGRLEKLLSAVRASAQKSMSRRDGTIREVLLETETSGRTSCNLWVHIEEKRKPGEKIKVKIDKISDLKLTARILQ